MYSVPKAGLTIPLAGNDASIEAVGRQIMFIAMNRFRVAKGQEEAFEERWRSRESYLDQVPGFQEFHLLRGPEREDHTLYASHTLWADKNAFTAWTQSEQFRAAHRTAGDTKPLHLGHPEFEGFDAVQILTASRS